MQPFLPKYSLKHRFLLVLIGLSLVLSVVVITAYHHIRLQRIENELALQLGVAVAHTGPLILQAHEAGETQMLRALMQALFGFPAVDCVFLAQTEGRILASWPPDACSTSQSDLFFPLSHHDVSLHIVTQIAYAYEEVRRSTALFGLSVLVLLVSIAGLVYLLIGRFVMGPLAKLQNAMERSAPDNPVLARELRDDEIGQLARAYNRLAAAARRFLLNYVKQRPRFEKVKHGLKIWLKFQETGFMKWMRPCSLAIFLIGSLKLPDLKTSLS